MKIDDDLLMQPVRPTPGMIGPERGLVFQSRLWHPMTFHPSSPPHLMPPASIIAYRLQFWDCLIVARTFGVRDGSFINPETGHRTNRRVFGVMDPRSDPIEREDLGKPVFAFQTLEFSVGSETLTRVRVTPRPGTTSPELVQLTMEQERQC